MSAKKIMSKEEAFKELLIKALYTKTNPKDKPSTMSFYKEKINNNDFLFKIFEDDTTLLLSKKNIVDVLKFSYKMKNDNEIHLFIKTQLKKHLCVEIKAIYIF